MRFSRLSVLAVTSVWAMAAAAPAMAADEDFELWFAPTFEFGIDDDTAFEIQTAQRFRDEDRGRVDTYYVRGWIKQKVSDNVTLAAALEKRANDGGADETRILQQVYAKNGYLRTRLRFEQRFAEGQDGRVGLRLRPRLGVSVPVAERVSFGTSAELFFTLRGNSPTSDTGLTGLQTVFGFDYEISENLGISLAYLREQNIRDGRPDRVGHAPQIGIDFSF